jgi:hypothetical protein
MSERQQYHVGFFYPTVYPLSLPSHNLCLKLVKKNIQWDKPQMDFKRETTLLLRNARFLQVFQMIQLFHHALAWVHSVSSHPLPEPVGWNPRIDISFK